MEKLADFAEKVEAFFRRSTMAALVALAVIAGGLTGLVLSYQLSFTSFAAEVDALQDYRPAEITKVYADDGKTVIGELALERRIPLTYEQLPENLKRAIMAIEDTRFFSHLGIDPYRLAGAVVQSLTSGNRVKGTSTLTQQLARELFLSKERSPIRKAKEALYALQIERVYTKEQIFTLYCNQIFLGGGAYGFEAAANYYYSKPLKDLTLDQYAMLAALPKSPINYSPILRPKAATERRNLVLTSMAEVGYISEAEAETLKKKPLGLNPNETRNKNDKSPHAYFIEEVRQELQRILGRNDGDAMEVYKAGLSVYTTLDAQAQEAATEAVRKGARMYQKRHGWRKVQFNNILVKEDGTPTGVELNDYQHYTWSAVAPKVEEVITGVIKEVSDKGTLVSFGPYAATITAADMSVTGRQPSKLFKRGDLAQFSVISVDEAKRSVKVKLEPEPEVQTALVMIEAKTGEIKAMSGGYDFSTTKFNHATQANRQTGSAFKPFIYAAALEYGLRPDDVVEDSPLKIRDWQPHNYDEKYQGTMPLRKALAQSRNIPAVRVLQEIGIQTGVNMVKKFGLPNQMAPFLPSALGATEEPLLSMTSAYTAFPNQGVRVEPVFIRKVVDRDGNVIEEAKPKSYKVMSEYVAAQMVDMMRGVVLEGTARAASAVGHEIAGKTGTVNDFTDAWFIGYTPKFVTGVWIGYSDSKEPLGKGETGGTAALPFWIDFMKDYLKDRPKDRFGKIPPLPDDLRQLQAARARDRANDRSRLTTGKGDIMPGSKELPNLDPLDGMTAPPPAPARNNAPPPSQPATVREAPPQPAPERNERPKMMRPPDPTPAPTPPPKKGKKGKGNDGN
jgi:penicillin-binding protein 1A